MATQPALSFRRIVMLPILIDIYTFFARPGRGGGVDEIMYNRRRASFEKRNRRKIPMRLETGGRRQHHPKMCVRGGIAGGDLVYDNTSILCCRIATIAIIGGKRAPEASEKYAIEDARWGGSAMGRRRPEAM